MARKTQKNAPAPKPEGPQELKASTILVNSARTLDWTREEVERRRADMIASLNKGDALRAGRWELEGLVESEAKFGMLNECNNLIVVIPATVREMGTSFTEELREVAAELDRKAERFLESRPWEGHHGIGGELERIAGSAQIRALQEMRALVRAYLKPARYTIVDDLQAPRLPLVDMDGCTFPDPEPQDVSTHAEN